MILQEIPRVKNITKAQFVKQYLKPQKPVVLEGLTKDWPAYELWRFSYIKSLAKDKQVPLYDDRPVSYKDGFNQPHATMSMGEYIDLLEQKPTKFRIFLWNILKEVPALQKDFTYPDIGIAFLKKLPMLFFGGTNSYTFMHYDIDLANILHFHFQGEKTCILFGQDQNKYLYKIPFSLITREDIDFSNPDYTKWPKLKQAKGVITKLKHGDALYIPEGYWHYMRYDTPGFSMSLRGLARKPKHLTKAVYNIFIMRYVDNALRYCIGQRWIDFKNKKAVS